MATVTKRPTKQIGWDAETAERVERQRQRLGLPHASTCVALAINEWLRKHEQDEKEEE